MDREEIIKTATRISELRGEISRLSGLQKELRRLEAFLDGLAGTTPVPAANRNINVKVLELLDQEPKADFEALDIAKGLAIQVPTARAALSKLFNAGEIRKVGRGLYRSKEARESEGDKSRAA